MEEKDLECKHYKDNDKLGGLLITKFYSNILILINYFATL